MKNRHKSVDLQDLFNLVADKDVPLCVPAQHHCQHVEALRKYRKGVASFAALQVVDICNYLFNHSNTAKLQRVFHLHTLF